MDLSPEEEKQRGLTRERLVDAALALINDEGLEGLAMRALAERLDVKAASLYWHVRDRQELLELLAESLLEGVRRPRPGDAWRESVVAIAESLRREAARQKDARRILLEAPETLRRSDVLSDLRVQLQAAGLSQTEAAGVALMAMTYAISGDPQMAEQPVIKQGAMATVAIDSGSRGVVLRTGHASMQSLIEVAHERTAAAPAVVQGETVVVRRLRGVGKGEIELNPRHPWSFKIQAPTWNTVLDLAGLDVRRIHVDSGASRIECFLPEPRGVVPIHIASGVVGVSIHRPRGAAVVATVHTGAVKLKLDDYTTKVAVFDVHWQSEGAATTPDRYELDVSSGAVNFQLDVYAPKVQQVEVAPVAAAVMGKEASALEILLDGVEARARLR